MPRPMIRYIELILLATLIPTLATSSLSVRRFIAPQQLYVVDPDDDHGTDEGTTSSRDAPPAEPSPLEFLAFRPEATQYPSRISHLPIFGKPTIRPLHERMPVVQANGAGRPELGRTVTQARCMATSLTVVAPRVQCHAPPTAPGR